MSGSQQQPAMGNRTLAPPFVASLPIIIHPHFLPAFAHCSKTRTFYPHPRLSGTRILPAPSTPVYPQFTRTLGFVTRNLPAPSAFFYPQFTRTLGIFTCVITRTLDTHLPAVYPNPRCFVPAHTRDPCRPLPRAFRARGARPPNATRTRYLTRARTLPVPVAPAARHYPATRETLSPVHTRDPRAPCLRKYMEPVAPAARHYPPTREALRPCILATHAPRAPVSLPAAVRCPSPWNPRPVSSPSPCVFVPAVPVARHYPTARARACPHPHRGAYFLP